MTEDFEIDFFFEDMAVGYFMDVPAYPTVPGRYRYMPYRGPGHYDMGEELDRTGSARCSYPTPAGVVEFVVRERPEYGVLVLDEFTMHRAGEDE